MVAVGFGVVDESVWGKSRGLDPALRPYPLVRHLLDTAAMALFCGTGFCRRGNGVVSLPG